MKQINKIIKSGLCLGCGHCEGIVTSDKCKMQINANGFYVPEFSKRLSKQEIAKILAVCPAITVNGYGEKKVWGETKIVSESWATNVNLRNVSSSGGVVSALATYLLDKKVVDGILHVGVKENSYLFNELKISKNANDILRNVGSRYAPALIFDKIKLILDSSNEVFAFIGKPCDIAGMKNYLEVYPEYRKRVTFFIGIFCAGIPSMNGTKKMIKMAEIDETPISLKYRGDGWPGFFEINYKNSPTFKVSYNDSWRAVLGKHVGLRCRICPDGIGLLADIVAGDAWSTRDGFPDFEEREGKSFVLARTTRGEEIFKEALKDGVLVSKNLDVKNIKIMQRYQYRRRVLVGYRLIAIQVLSGFILRFRKIGIWRLMLKANPKSGILNMIGTGKRFIIRKSSIS
uniref:Coenzyme F420 hydrogenase/dehydrogenase, beta subunit C-terminal domain n=1 Tax=uncultured Draconibacterium sp. TaxID=1573823 RepID=UPI003218045C